MLTAQHPESRTAVKRNLRKMFQQGHEYWDLVPGGLSSALGEQFDRTALLYHT